MVTAFLLTETPCELPFLLSGQEFTPRFYLASGQTRCSAGKHCQTDPSPRRVIRRTNSSFLTHRGGCQALSLLFWASWLTKGYVQSQRVACPPRAAWEAEQIAAGAWGHSLQDPEQGILWEQEEFSVLPEGTRKGREGLGWKCQVLPNKPNH